MSHNILTHNEIARIEAETRKFFETHRRVEDTAAFSRRITELANARDFTPQLPSTTIEKLLRLLRQPAPSVTAATLERCFEVLRMTVLIPRERSLPLERRSRPFKVLVCAVRADAETTTNHAIIGSANDPSTKPGCDRGAGVDYYAKTDNHIVYVAASLLTRDNLSTPKRVIDGDAAIVSLTLMAVLHEFAHAYSTMFADEFAKLRTLYYAAVAVAHPIVERAATNHNAARLLLNENDCMEFLAQAFAYENSRVDFDERHADQQYHRLNALGGRHPYAAAMSASLPLLLDSGEESPTHSVSMSSSSRSYSSCSSGGSGSEADANSRRNSGADTMTSVGSD